MTCPHLYPGDFIATDDGAPFPAPTHGGLGFDQAAAKQSAVAVIDEQTTPANCCDVYALLGTAGLTGDVVVQVHGLVGSCTQRTVSLTIDGSWVLIGRALGLYDLSAVSAGRLGVCRIDRLGTNPADTLDGKMILYRVKLEPAA